MFFSTKQTLHKVTFSKILKLFPDLHPHLKAAGSGSALNLIFWFWRALNKFWYSFAGAVVLRDLWLCVLHLVHGWRPQIHRWRGSQRLHRRQYRHPLLHCHQAHVGDPHLQGQWMHSQGKQVTKRAVLWIRIRSDPGLWPGSESWIICFGSISSKNEKADKLKFYL